MPIRGVDVRDCWGVVALRADDACESALRADVGGFESMTVEASSASYR